MDILKELLEMNGIESDSVPTDKDRIKELETIIEEQNVALMELAELISEVVE